MSPMSPLKVGNSRLRRNLAFRIRIHNQRELCANQYWLYALKGVATDANFKNER